MRVQQIHFQRCREFGDLFGEFGYAGSLLEQGYRRPLCIHLPEGGAAPPLRRKGMQRAFKEFNVAEKYQAHVVLIHKPDHLQSVQFRDEPDYLQTVSFLNEALDRRPRPDCVICGNDRVALVAYQHLLSRGFRIPNDIGMLGFDDMVKDGQVGSPCIANRLLIFLLMRSCARALSREPRMVASTSDKLNTINDLWKMYCKKPLFSDLAEWTIRANPGLFNVQRLTQLRELL